MTFYPEGWWWWFFFNIGKIEFPEQWNRYATWNTSSSYTKTNYCPFKLTFSKNPSGDDLVVCSSFPCPWAIQNWSKTQSTMTFYLNWLSEDSAVILANPHTRTHKSIEMQRNKQVGGDKAWLEGVATQLILGDQIWSLSLLALSLTPRSHSLE